MRRNCFLALISIMLPQGCFFATSYYIIFIKRNEIVLGMKRKAHMYLFESIQRYTFNGYVMKESF